MRTQHGTTGHYRLPSNSYVSWVTYFYNLWSRKIFVRLYVEQLELQSVQWPALPAYRVFINSSRFEDSNGLVLRSLHSLQPWLSKHSFILYPLYYYHCWASSKRSVNVILKVSGVTRIGNKTRVYRLRSNLSNQHTTAPVIASATKQGNLP